MIMILVLWVLGLLVIAIGWGWLDDITFSIKSRVHLVLTAERNIRLQILVASCFGFLGLVLIAATADDRGVMASLPTLLIWAGGLWLIPFQFHAADWYWLFFLAIAVGLAQFLVWGTTSHSTRTHPLQDTLTQQGQDASISMNGLGFLFWISLIGFTAAIVRYTSTGSMSALHS